MVPFVVVPVIVVVILVTVLGAVSAWNCNDALLYLSFVKFVVAVFCFCLSLSPSHQSHAAIGSELNHIHYSLSTSFLCSKAARKTGLPAEKGKVFGVHRG